MMSTSYISSYVWGRIAERLSMGWSPPLRWRTRVAWMETGLQNCMQSIAAPMAMAHAARRHGDQRILDPRGHLSLRTNVFDKQEDSSRLEHAPDLAHPALWITHRTEDECGHHAIEMRIGEREGLDRGTGERDGNESSSQSAPRFDQHGLIRLDRLYPHHTGGIVKGEVLSTTLSLCPPF